MSSFSKKKETMEQRGKEISLMIQLTAAFLVGFVITIYMIITHPGKWNTFAVLWLACPFFGSAGATDWNRNDINVDFIRASTQLMIVLLPAGLPDKWAWHHKTNDFSAHRNWGSLRMTYHKYRDSHLIRHRNLLRGRIAIAPGYSDPKCKRIPFHYKWLYQVL